MTTAINRYEKCELVGSGSFGEVFRGVDLTNGQPVALKLVDLEKADDEIDIIQREIKVMSSISHPHVVQYHTSLMHDSTLWIVMEYMAAGSLKHLLDGVGPFPEDAIATVLKALCKGLDYVHKGHKLHRDIKAANILLSAQGEVKLADFGVAGQMTQTIRQRNTFVGSPFWMAPEVVQESLYDEKADIWSVGITGMELANGVPPYALEHPFRALRLIVSNDPPRLQGPNFSRPFRDFTAMCLKKNPADRLSADALLSHPFLRKARSASIRDLLRRRDRALREAGGQTAASADSDAAGGGAGEGTGVRGKECASEPDSVPPEGKAADTSVGTRGGTVGVSGAVVHPDAALEDAATDVGNGPPLAKWEFDFGSLDDGELVTAHSGPAATNEAAAGGGAEKAGRQEAAAVSHDGVIGDGMETWRRSEGEGEDKAGDGDIVTREILGIGRHGTHDGVNGVDGGECGDALHDDDDDDDDEIVVRDDAALDDEADGDLSLSGTAAPARDSGANSGFAEDERDDEDAEAAAAARDSDVLTQLILPVVSQMRADLDAFGDRNSSTLMTSLGSLEVVFLECERAKRGTAAKLMEALIREACVSSSGEVRELLKRCKQ